MKIEYIKEFLVFAESATVSAASRQLHLTQPTLSNHIAALESELGTKLVYHGRDMRLTNAGRVFVDAGTDLISHYESFAHAVQEAGSGMGELNVLLNGSFTPILYRQWTRFVHIYLSRHPKATVHHANCGDATVWDALADGRYDCCVVPFVPLPQDAEHGIIFEDLGLGGSRIGLWVKKDSPLAKLDEVHWSDLQGYPHPMFSGAARLWNSCVRELYAQHGVELDWRPIPCDMIGAGRKFRDNEICTTDDVNPQAAEAIWPDWTVIPLADDDAVSRAYLAYRPDNDRTALRDMLEYLHSERQPDAIP